MSQTGFVTARVYTSNAQLPVEGATVAVTRRTPEGKVSLLGVRVTDEDGNIPPVSVETPDVEQSLTPQGEQAWAYCDITADSPPYERVIVANAQVFPGITSLQQLQLVPLPEYPDELGSTTVFSVYPPQNL